MLYLLAVLIWYGAEIVEFFRQQQWRKDAARVGPRSFWPWLSVALIMLSILAIIIWRIRVEEHALLATLDDRYRAYAAHRKRLVPLIW